MLYSGYQCTYVFNTAQTCISTISSTSLQIGECGGEASSIDSQIELSIPFTSTQDGAVTTVTTLVLYAPMFQMVWQASGNSTNTSSSLVSTSADTSSISTNPPSPAPSTISSPAAQTSAPPSSSLSPSQSAGIGSGVGLAVVLILALIFWIVRRRRRQIQRAPPENPRSTSSNDSHQGEEPLHELGSQCSTTAELLARPRQRELGTDGEIVEMTDGEIMELG